MSYSWFVAANGGIDYWTTSMDSANFYTFGDMQTAITFRVNADYQGLDGYYYWYDTAHPELVPGGFALWECNDDPSTGLVVDGSVIASLPTPTTTGWQFAALGTPLELVNGKVYRMEFAHSGGFYWASNYSLFETTGILNEPLEVFSDSEGSFPIPTTGAPGIQGSYAIVTHVPGTNYPNTSSSSGVPAIDVEISLFALGPLAVATESLPNAELLTQYKKSVVATGGTPPYTYAVTAGSLPSGVTLGSDGKFSGIPAALGTYSFTVTATDAVAATADKGLSLKVTNPTFLAALDTFVRSDGPLGSNWLANTTSGGMLVSGDKAIGQVGNYGSIWVKDYFTPDQFSEIVLGTVPTSSDWIGPVVRSDSTGDNCYVAIIFPGSPAIQLFKRSPGNSYSFLGSHTVSSFSVGDILRLSVSGTTLNVNYNGTDVLTVTDASYSAGQPGMGAYGNTGAVSEWTGGNGPGIVQVSYSSTSGHVDTYTVRSQINNTGNAGRQDMRVLRPTTPNPGYPHAFLWLLPVEPGQGTTYGDSIATIQALAAQDNYNLTCIQPGFPIDPWYGNNVDDPSTQQETFLQDLASFADTDLYISGTEKHFLIGFSKSGYGGQTIFMRNQSIYSGVASWDTACDYQLLTDYGGDGTASYGEQSQLDDYKLYDPNLTTWKAEGDTATVNRIWLGAGINLITQTSDYSDRLTADGILHTYAYALTDSHNWAPTPGWVAPALAAIIGPPTLAVPRLMMASGIL